VKSRIESDGTLKGINVKGKVVKNKCAPPYKIAEFDIMFGKGINSEGCMLDVAESLGIVERRGSYYFMNGERIAQGRDKSIEVIATNATIQSEILNSIQANLPAKIV